jgi:heterodisulfide reductase subunit B
MQGIVFNPLEYAPYVEYGTGAFREEGATSGYWVYVLESEGSTPHAKSSKRYTLEEAKQIVASMRADGIEAVYTQGQPPRPFMRPALDENREEIKRVLREAITSD